MVPTHFAVLAVFIFPHEKPTKITAEEGVGEERSHKSNKLPVKSIKRTLLLLMCIVTVLPRLNISLTWLFSSLNTLWVNRNISHRRQNSYVIVFSIMNYWYLLMLPPERKKGVDPTNVSKKKHHPISSTNQPISVHSTPWNVPSNRIISFWGSKKINGEIRESSKMSVFRPINYSSFLKQ